MSVPSSLLTVPRVPENWEKDLKSLLKHFLHESKERSETDLHPTSTLIVEQKAICRKGLINEIALRPYSDLPANYFISSRLEVVTGESRKG